MKLVGRILLGLLATIGVLAVLVTVAVVMALRAHGPVELGRGTAGGAQTSSPAPAGGLVADNLKADVTVPFATLEQKAGRPVSLSDAGGGRLRVAAPATALGREWKVTADGDLAVDGADVVVHPQHVSVDGLAVLDGLVSAVAQQAVSVRMPITGLPQGVTVTRVTSTPQGVRAAVEGSGVALPTR